jgi:hypothetical protein
MVLDRLPRAAFRGFCWKIRVLASVRPRCPS